MISSTWARASDMADCVWGLALCDRVETRKENPGLDNCILTLLKKGREEEICHFTETLKAECHLRNTPNSTLGFLPMGLPAPFRPHCASLCPPTNSRYLMFLNPCCPQHLALAWHIVDAQ